MAFFDTAQYANYGNGTSTGYYAVAQFATSHVYTAGTWVRQLTAPSFGNERIFVCIVAGTSTTEPSWTVTRGAKNTSGTATFQECTGQAGPNGDLTNCPVWAASTAFTLGEVIYDVTSGSLQILSTASGNTSGSKPTFSATAGVTTSDTSNVWTSLGPASNYTGWQYPHARIANAVATTWNQAGQTIYAASASAETGAATTSLATKGTAASPVKILSVSTSAAPPTALSAGASITTTGANTLTIEGSASACSYWYGVSFIGGSGDSSGMSMNISNTTPMDVVFDSCTFNLASTAASSTIQFTGWMQLLACTFIFGNTSQVFKINGGPNILIRGGTFAGSGSVPTTAFNFGTVNSTLLVDGLDISAVTGNLCNIATGASQPAGMNVVFENCKLGSGVSATTGSFTQIYNGGVKIHNSDSTNTNYRYYYTNYAGTVQHETTTYLNASDGTTNISWNFASSANSNFEIPFQSEEIMIWNDTTGSSKTATIELTTATTLTNGDFWVEFEYLGNSSYPISSKATTRVADILTMTAALTTSSASWNSAKTNKYSVSASFTPQQKGYIKARIYLAKPSVTVYVDPKITVA